MKDWSKERWRKLYIREAFEQELWSVMARGLRDYLIRLADDDGALIRDSDDPVDDLLRGLHPDPNETELVRGAIGVLRRDGFLSGGARSMFVRNLPAAQAWEPRVATGTPELPVKSRPSSSSKERVRRFRERQAAAAALLAHSVPTAADAPSPVTSGVTSPVTDNPGNVTDAANGPVTSSRGSRNLESSENFLDLQKDKQKDLPPSSARASAVTSVTSVTSVTERRADDEDGEKFPFPPGTKQPVTRPVRERAAEIQDRPALARVTHPEQWPELIGVARALERSTGLPQQRLGQYDRDPGVRALVALYATGFTQRELERVAEIVPKQAWWSAPGKRLGLSSLSIEVVRRNLPGIGPQREASPTVAKVLASLEKRREAG